MIEDLLKEHIAALNANTEALNANTAAHLGTASAAPAPAAKKAKAAPAVAAPEEPTPPDTPAPEEPETPTPTPTPAKAAKAADTPHVPAAAAPAPGQPDAGEHVDPDEIISSIQATVKAKMLAGDPDAVKAAWTAVQKGFGIARVAELRNDPARLLEALAKAKAL
jgi:hypothetical protein